jgi:hypothetical protein
LRIITGMHRSGTSLVARLFFEGGADLGDPATFHPGDRWNEDGYFEQPEFQEINRALTQGPYGRLAYFRLPARGTILKRGARIAGRIRETSDRFRGKVVKETRFCLTLPAWRENGATVAAILACLRHPTAVARSLRRRNRIPLALGYRLWVEHNRRLLEEARGIPLRWISYARLVDPSTAPREIGEAFRFLGRPLPEGGTAPLARSCVRPELDHGAAPEGDLPPAVDALWRDLVGRHGGQGTAADGVPAGGRAR